MRISDWSSDVCSSDLSGTTCFHARPAHKKGAADKPPHLHDRRWVTGGYQAAASFSFFSGRILTFTDAGLAANHCSSLVNGLMPLRFGLAGTLTAEIFSSPGNMKEPAPFLGTDRSDKLRVGKEGCSTV